MVRAIPSTVLSILQCSCGTTVSTAQSSGWHWNIQMTTLSSGSQHALTHPIDTLHGTAIPSHRHHRFRSLRLSSSLLVLLQRQPLPLRWRSRQVAHLCLLLLRPLWLQAQQQQAEEAARALCADRPRASRARSHSHIHGLQFAAVRSQQAAVGGLIYSYVL
jgi:hypothetical protein